MVSEGQAWKHSRSFIADSIFETPIFTMRATETITDSSLCVKQPAGFLPDKLMSECVVLCEPLTLLETCQTYLVHCLVIVERSLDYDWLPVLPANTLLKATDLLWVCLLEINDSLEVKGGVFGQQLMDSGLMRWNINIIKRILKI